MKFTGYLVAIVLGALLGATPFARYAFAGPHSEATMDHGPRFGGHLLMVRNHHIELVEHDESVELFVSDLKRRPLRPQAATIMNDAQEALTMRWHSYRLVGERPKGTRTVYTVALQGGATLTFKYP